jgi:hypothetical protein
LYPEPVPGLVLRYSYLWRREADQGNLEGQKYRPCVVIVCVQRYDDELIVTVAPITHTQPDDPSEGVRLTGATCRRLGLDSQTQWIVATEFNRFVWPGPDLSPTPDGRPAYGQLPEVVFEALKARVLELSAPPTEVQRTE